MAQKIGGPGLRSREAGHLIECDSYCVCVCACVELGYFWLTRFGKRQRGRMTQFGG